MGQNNRAVKIYYDYSPTTDVFIIVVDASDRIFLAYAKFFLVIKLSENNKMCQSHALNIRSPNGYFVQPKVQNPKKLHLLSYRIAKTSRYSHLKNLSFKSEKL